MRTWGEGGHPQAKWPQEAIRAHISSWLQPPGLRTQCLLFKPQAVVLCPVAERKESESQPGSGGRVVAELPWEVVSKFTRRGRQRQRCFWSEGPASSVTRTQAQTDFLRRFSSLNPVPSCPGKDPARREKGSLTDPQVPLMECARYTHKTHSHANRHACVCIPRLDMQTHMCTRMDTCAHTHAHRWARAQIMHTCTQPQCPSPAV